MRTEGAEYVIYITVTKEKRTYFLRNKPALIVNR